MSSIHELNGTSHRLRRVSGIALLALTAFTSGAFAQGDRDRPGDRDRDDRDRVAITRLEPGMNLPVRLTESVASTRQDYRVFNAVVERDVRGDDGRLAIPRGSQVELIVRSSRPDEMVLDLESILVNGQRYAVKTDPKQIVGTAGHDDIVGSIVDAIRGGRVRGDSVNVPRGTVMNFRLERPLDIGVPDWGVNRNGHHYHDYYGRGRGGN